MKVHNCHNRKFILKALTDSGRRGISVAAYWQNGSEVITEHTAAIKAGDRYPSYSEATTNLKSDGVEAQGLTIICSSRVDLTSSLQESKGNTEALSLDSGQVAFNKERTVESGININDSLWAEINRLGAGVLVSSSEQSRQGAGGR